MSDFYREIIVSNAKVKIAVEDLKDEYSLVDDLGYDSISFVSMVVAIEGSYDFEFDDDYLAISALQTVKDVADYIKKKKSK